MISTLSKEELTWAKEKSLEGYPVWQIAAALHVSPEALYKGLDRQLHYKPSRDRYLPPLKYPRESPPE